MADKNRERNGDKIVLGAVEHVERMRKARESKNKGTDSSARDQLILNPTHTPGKDKPTKETNKERGEKVEKVPQRLKSMEMEKSPGGGTTYIEIGQ